MHAAAPCAARCRRTAERSRGKNGALLLEHRPLLRFCFCRVSCGTLSAWQGVFAFNCLVPGGCIPSCMRALPHLHHPLCLLPGRPVGGWPVWWRDAAPAGGCQCPAWPRLPPPGSARALRARQWAPLRPLRPPTPAPRLQGGACLGCPGSALQASGRRAGLRTAGRVGSWARRLRAPCRAACLPQRRSVAV